MSLKTESMTDGFINIKNERFCFVFYCILYNKFTKITKEILDL